MELNKVQNESAWNIKHTVEQQYDDVAKHNKNRENINCYPNVCDPQNFDLYFTNKQFWCFTIKYDRQTD